ncbi:lipase [Thelonectria olida]|uniref:Lipase n=1 Tax=Thelonectria olida TaxID=1576542 RepID=A0A9P9AH71_9HYPO|nr:lipase [Thelonectria olida]
MLLTSALLSILSLGGLLGKSVLAQALNNPDGLVNLRDLAQEIERTAPGNKSIPIVFVPGFSGWGAPLFGALNYFGGVFDIPKLLADRGHTVIVAPVAPISTNWERACELYRQLTFGNFSTVNSATNSIDEVYDVDVDYGTYFAADPAHAPEQASTAGRRRAILFSNSSDFRNWTWDRHHKVHFVCHSQGGNTVRYLISLMAKGTRTLHPTYFTEAGRDDWTISITTLGTPHRGTTFINALESFLSRSRKEAVGLVARLFATASFYPPERRAYDLQLDHWGIRRKPGETFQDMLVRMESVNGSVWKWLNSDNNGLYDNSIEGVHDLSLKAINTSENIHYFSLSFHATDPFPEAWPAWGGDAWDSFPTNIESFVREVTQNIPIIGRLVGIIISAFTNLGWRVIMAVTSFRSFVEWVTEAVISRVLQELGYNLVLPKPGRYIPRKDVIPILLPSVYAMGSQELTQVQRNILGPNLGDWYQNDGIVNTESMSGPDNFVRGINSLPDLDFSIPGKRGIYWHLGVNDQMDHADQIGVFIEQSTVRLRSLCC